MAIGLRAVPVCGDINQGGNQTAGSVVQVIMSRSNVVNLVISPVFWLLVVGTVVLGMVVAACGSAGVDSAGVENAGVDNAGVDNAASSETEPTVATAPVEPTAPAEPTAPVEPTAPAEPAVDAEELGAGELAFGLQRCVSGAPFLAADPAFYRDEPIYVGNEQPTEEVRNWATSRPGYEDIWVDRDNNGWIAVGFSEDAAVRQAELEAEFPGVGVVAVAVAATDAELMALRSEVEVALDGLSNWALGHSVARGFVEVSVPVLDEQTLSRLAPLAGPRLCVQGADPADAIPDGPQPTERESWRLLGTDRTGPPYRTGVATTGAQYDALWQEAGLTSTQPSVDFRNAIVIWFGAVYGSNCPVRMDDVIIDLERNLIHGDFVIPGNPTVCNSDANGEAYVVSVARRDLPEGGFAVQLNATDPPAGAPEERTTVTVDLRTEATVATPDDLVVGTLDNRNVTPRQNVFVPGMVMEDGFPMDIGLDLACILEVIGPLNGFMWQAQDWTERPVEWAQDATDGLAQAELLLSTNPAGLAVSVNGVSVDYTPLPSTSTEVMECY